MGIKNLLKFIKTNYSNSCKSSSILDLEYSKIAIDTSIYMFKFKSMNACNIQSNSWNPDKWIWSFVYMIHYLRKNNVHPIFILDGKGPPEKTNTSIMRKQTQQKISEKTQMMEAEVQKYRTNTECDEEFNFDKQESKSSDMLTKEWSKISKRYNLGDFSLDEMASRIAARHRYDITIDFSDYDKLCVLLKIMNVPYIKAPGEAEALCAFLSIKKYISGVMTLDTDILVYWINSLNNNSSIESCKMIFDINFSTNNITFCDPNTLLSEMNISPVSFVDMCIMCGTDYNANIPGIGLKTALKLIKNNKCPSLNEKIKNYDRIIQIFTSFGDMHTSYANNIPKISYCGKPHFDMLKYMFKKLKITIPFDWMIKDF
jgi:5'-3' exonuclease